MNFDFLTLGYMQRGLAAAILVGSSCATVGIYIILQNMVFVSMVLAQLAVFGLSLAKYFQVSEVAEVGIAFLATIIGVFYFALARGDNKVSPDAKLGMSYAALHSFSLLLLAKSSEGLGEIQTLMSGNLLSVNAGEIKILCVVTIVMMLTHYFAQKPFIFITTDPEFAKISSLKVKFWEILFYLSLGLIISVSLRITGMLYVFSCLVFPAMTCNLVFRSFSGIQRASIALSVLAAFFGVYFSFALDFPTSESIMLFHAIFFIMIAGVYKVMKLRELDN